LRPLNDVCLSDVCLKNGNIISNNPPWKEWHSRFTTVHLKAFSDEVFKDIHYFVFKTDYFNFLLLYKSFLALETMV